MHTSYPDFETYCTANITLDDYIDEQNAIAGTDDLEQYLNFDEHTAINILLTEDEF